MEYISRRMRRLRKMRRRKVRFWRESCPSVRRRKRLIRGVLFLLAAGTMAWAKTGRGHDILGPEQIPYMERIRGERSGQGCGPGWHDISEAGIYHSSG